MLFGYKDYEVTGNGFSRLLAEIPKNRIALRKMTEKKDVLFVRISAEYCGQFEKICTENGCTPKETKSSGFVKLPGFAKRRPGIVFGIITVCFLLAFFSQRVVSIKVPDVSENVRHKVITVLKENGIKAGTYIPRINYTVVERTLRKNIDEISWAGITRKGSVLIIDTVENIQPEKSRKERLPSNLVSAEDGVVEKLDVLDGQVKYGVGCGVCKGDVLVSGEVVTTNTQWIDGKEQTDTKVTYTRSIGKVYGTFERTVTFEQPFEEREEILTGKQKNLYSANFFSADIPLYFRKPDGFFKSVSETEKFGIYGIEFPFGITKTKLSEYDFVTKNISRDECERRLEKKIYNYEKNFLKDYEIKDRNIEISADKKYVRETVTYKLYGTISKEVEFFIKK